MNRYLFVFIVSIFIVSNAFAQLPDHRKADQKPKEPRKTQVYENVPQIPGWVHVKELDTDYIYYVKPTEVTLLDWTYFMLDRYKTEKIGQPTYQFIIPENNEINERYFFNIPELEGLWNDQKSVEQLTPDVIKKILVAKGVDKIPVTGISYQAAASYMEYVSISYKGITASGIHNPFDLAYDVSKYHMLVSFPTSEDYRILLSHFHKPNVDTLQYKEYITRGYDGSFCPMFNASMPEEVTTGNCPSIQPNSALVLKFGRVGRAVYPAGTYDTDAHGLYDIRGNVSEMTKNEGIAMGGGYRTPAGNCNAQSAQAYSRPATWLGFRPVIQIKKVY
ncbi:MAG TPA: SUMF1/EgtB/PvdO family nonheme iron enzyme [Cytophagaceae bacterium]|jgi:hypothetical protein|nr:SUMF1/EgtB/PvdO family nonheme iron enzyme [Cytophagaceae bacterium]